MNDSALKRKNVGLVSHDKNALLAAKAKKAQAEKMKTLEKKIESMEKEIQNLRRLVEDRQNV